MQNEIDILALRENLGLTQAQLGERVGVDQSTVSNWENGQKPRGPARMLLSALADKAEKAKARKAKISEPVE